MIVGITGLMVDKRKSDPRRIAKPMRTMDLAFIIALLLVNVTGILLLALRETVAMPTLLAVHLGYTAALFVTLPYGKFAHAIYRYLALLRNRLELAHERRELAHQRREQLAP